MKKTLFGIGLLMLSVSSFAQTTQYGFPRHNPDRGSIICSIDSSAKLRQLKLEAESKTGMTCFAKEINGGVLGVNRSQIFCHNADSDLYISNVTIECLKNSMLVRMEEFVELGQWLRSDDRKP